MKFKGFSLRSLENEWSGLAMILSIQKVKERGEKLKWHSSAHMYTGAVVCNAMRVGCCSPFLLIIFISALESENLLHDLRTWLNLELYFTPQEYLMLNFKYSDYDLNRLNVIESWKITHFSIALMWCTWFAKEQAFLVIFRCSQIKTFRKFYIKKTHQHIMHIKSIPIKFVWTQNSLKFVRTQNSLKFVRTLKLWAKS